MAASVNKAILVGHLGKDPDIRRTQDGKPIANFSIATSESWRDKSSGERKERTQWHQVVVFNENLAKFVEQYLKKGSKVWVEGQIENRKWTKDGVDKYVTEIVLRSFNCSIEMLDSKGDGSGWPPPNDDVDGAASSRTRDSGGGSRHDIDSEIPF